MSQILFICRPYHWPGLNADIHPSPWKITHAVCMDEAAERLGNANFDLVFIESEVLDDSSGVTIPQLKALCPGVPVVLLVPPGHCKTRLLKPAADHVFIWSGTPEGFHAMVRCIEDSRCQDAGRGAVLLVEDIPEYTSFFLPAVYKGIDAAFPGARTPKLVLADSYETAMARFHELGEHLACVISDTRLPRQGKELPCAGIDILSTIHREMPDLPIMLMSAESVNKTWAQSIPAPFLDKNGPRPARTLHEFFLGLAADRPARRANTCTQERYPVQTVSGGLTRIGRGSIGGKARGLAFLAQTLERRPDLGTSYPEMVVNIPETLVLCTDIFEDFVRDNGLEKFVDQPLAELVQAFIDASLPREVLGHLERLPVASCTPLAVRSSSLLEDAAAHPCAGVYKTYMIPNNHADPGIRSSQLATAVKLVYASAYYKKARAFVRSTTARPFKDSMAVMIQAVAGSRYTDFFLPGPVGHGPVPEFLPGGQCQSP